MFGIGMPEMILILAVALIVIGPKKLPDLAKSLGKAMGEFKKATSDLKESMQIDTELKEVKTAFNNISTDDKKETTMVSGEAGEPPVEAAGPDETAGDSEPEYGDADSMDNLKAAFDRRNTDAPNSDSAASSAESDDVSTGTQPVSETREG